MKYPNFTLEKRLYQNGYQCIAGVDEVGRGAWAGPIVAAVIILPPQLSKNIQQLGIQDSKSLSSCQREKIFLYLKNTILAWSCGIVSNEIIDQIGINKANILAIELAIKKLPIKPDYILIDALSPVPANDKEKLNQIKIPCQTFIDGDQKILSIAAASIMAKVVRDYIMKFEHKNYPYFRFLSNCGYGTNLHRQMIKKYGPCSLHRFSFRPLKTFLP